MMSMNQTRVILKIGVALLCALILGFGIATAVTLGSLGEQKDKIQQAEKDLARAQKAIDDNPQIVVISGEERTQEITLQELNNRIRNATNENQLIVPIIKANPNANSQEVEFHGPAISAKDIIALIEKVEDESYPAKASRWTMRRDTNTNRLWTNVRIDFTLPKKPKDAK